MEQISKEQVIKFSQKVIRETYIYVPYPKREKITPRFAAWCIHLSEEMLVASAMITFVESCWKASFPGYSKIRSMKDITEFLTDSAKAAIKSYLNGEIKLIVKSSVARNTRSKVEGYFDEDSNDDASRTYDDSDFIIRPGLSDRVREVFR